MFLVYTLRRVQLNVLLSFLVPLLLGQHHATPPDHGPVITINGVVQPYQPFKPLRFRAVHDVTKDEMETAVQAFFKAHGKDIKYLKLLQITKWEDKQGRWMGFEYRANKTKWRHWWQSAKDFGDITPIKGELNIPWCEKAATVRLEEVPEDFWWAEPMSLDRAIVLQRLKQQLHVVAHVKPVE